jgi:ABC-type polysaccharide/polyol phosphate transport system ATPase subunit
MTQAPVIEATHIVKYYNRHPQLMRLRGEKLLTYVTNWISSWRRSSRFMVLNDINIKIYPGEAVGIVGSNGSGKSTLLRILTGISLPTSGTVNINGEYRELFALNAGFNMDLSGRKNIYLYAAMKNISNNEIEDKIDDIISFSGLGNFIDEPVKTYSSGMRSRLGFSLVINTLPDIIFIDEALSPGDESFREKCEKALLKLIEEKKTIVLVTHNLGALRTLCSRVIWLENGTVKMDDQARLVINRYKTYQDSRK